MTRRFDAVFSKPEPRRVISAHSAKHLRRTEITQLEADGWKVEGDGKGRAETSSTSSPKADSNAYAERAAGVAAGKKEEADRWTSVLVSAEAKGKERQAIALLIANESMTAPNVIKTLASRSTDAENVRANAARKAAASASVWDRVIARLSA